MRETAFIQQNEKKWKEFEQILDGERNDPEKLNDLFIQVTDDLSYARTFYPNRSVRVYLNGLAQRIFFKIYKGKKSKRSRFAEFWVNELPLLLYQSRKDLVLSFVVFSLAIVIGMLSCYVEPDFLQLILGEQYVEMTKENIASGDPMAVYKEKGELNMFLGITLNNIMVAVWTFLFGVFYAIGTIGILIRNGIMLGAFQFFFIHEGLFWESFLAVWLHGAFEISSIVIAGAAGITMGRGLVFPGTLSRLRSFQLSARRGLSILAGTVPLFIIAGFIESFLTRYTDMPDVVRGTFILLCFGLVVFYYVIYPSLKVKRGMTHLADKNTRLNPDLSREIDLSEIKSVGDLFTDSFLFFRKKFKAIALAALAGSAFFTAGAFLFSESEMLGTYNFFGGAFGILSNLSSFFANPENPLLSLFAILSMTAVAFLVHRSANELWGKQMDEPPSKKWWHHLLDFLKTLVAVTLLNLFIAIDNGLGLVLILLSFQLIFIWSQSMVAEGKGVFNGLGYSFALAKGSYGPMVGLFLTMALIGLLFFLLLDSGLLIYLLQSVSMNFTLSETQGELLTTALMLFIIMFVFLLTFGFFVVGASLQYFSNLEVTEANTLFDRIEKIQTRKVIRGLEREG